MGNGPIEKNADPIALGIALGGTKILTAVVSARGEIFSRDHTITPSAKGLEVGIEAILQSVSRSLERGPSGGDSRRYDLSGPS